MSFAQQIVDWQKQHGRHELPWQNTTDAYRIWLSEIMLQQTQVATVKNYYDAFLTRFPTVFDLAQAQQDEVLALWAGLGYYSRARHLHACAQAVVRDWGGQFPQTPAQLQTLKGIGASTAAAIAVFAYGRRAAILDGNVKRILCRYFGIDAPANAATDKMLWQQAQQSIEALDERNAQDLRAYTQGLMDLGASLCARRKPNCVACPLHSTCFAAVHQQTERLPQAKAPTKVREMQMDFVIYRHQQHIWLEKNPSAGIWASLYVFPQTQLVSGSLQFELPPIVHRLTHRLLHLTAQVVDVSAEEARHLETNAHSGVWLNAHNRMTIGMPKPIADWVQTLVAESPQ